MSCQIVLAVARISLVLALSWPLPGQAWPTAGHACFALGWARPGLVAQASTLNGTKNDLRNDIVKKITKSEWAYYLTGSREILHDKHRPCEAQPGPGLAQAWFDLAQPWSRPAKRPRLAWPSLGLAKHRPCEAQLGPGLAQTWLDLAQPWSRLAKRPRLAWPSLGQAKHRPCETRPLRPSASKSN